MIEPNIKEELTTTDIPTAETMSMPTQGDMTLQDVSSEIKQDFTASQLEQTMPTMEEAGAEEAGLVSEIAKFGAKIIGKEVASDAPTVAREVLPKATVRDMSEIANKLITKDKVKPIAPKKPLIGEMVKKVPKVAPTQEAVVQGRFNNFEKGNSFIANDVNAEKEMLGLRESDLDKYSTTDAWQLNFNTIRDEDDLASTLAYMAENNQALIEAERGVAGTDEHILRMSKDIGADPDFITEVLTWENGGALPTSGYVMAIRQMLDSSAVKLRELAMIPDHQLTPEKQAEFLAQYDFHRRFQAKFMGIRAELSRSFRAIGIPYKEDDMQSFIAMAEAGLDVKTLKSQISKAETTAGINDLVNTYAGNNGKWTKDAIFSSYMGSILSGVGTQLLVTFGGATNMASRIAERKIASLMPSFKAEDNVAKEEFNIMMAAYRSSFSDGMKAFWKTFTTGEAYKGIGSFGEAALDIPAPSAQFKLTGVTALLADGIFKANQFMMRNAMGGTDAFFRTINERAELSMLAYRKAKSDVEAGIVPVEQFEQHLRGIMENPTADMANKVELFGREIGMQEPAGDIARKVQELSSTVPGMRYIVPFVNTLTNQMRQTIGERTPLALLREQTWKDINAGGAQAQLAIAKMATGTGYLSIAYGLAENGNLTGAYPKDKAERDAWAAAGIQPYSFVFKGDDGKNTYVSYQGLEPFATIFGVIGTFAQENESTLWHDLTKNEEQRFTETASKIMFALSETTLNKTFAVGLQNFFDAVQSPKAMEKLVSGLAGGLIPFQGARRNITKELDDIRRDTGGFWDEISSTIPGLSDGITPKLDIFGEEIKHKTNLMRWYPVEESNDPVIKEINRISDVMGTSVMSTFKDEFGGQSATPQERYRWAKYARSDRRDEEDNSLRDVLYNTIQEDYYKELTSYEQLKELSAIVKAWDSAALQELETDDPTLYSKISAREAGKEALRLIEKEGMMLEDAKRQAISDQEEQYFGGQ